MNSFDLLISSLALSNVKKQTCPKFTLAVQDFLQNTYKKTQKFENDKIFHLPLARKQFGEKLGLKVAGENIGGKSITLCDLSSLFLVK